MKTIYIKKFAVSLASLALLASCSDNTWNDKYLDGFTAPGSNGRPSYEQIEEINYTLTAENYAAISSYFAGQSNKDDEIDMYEAIKTYNCFPNEEVARATIPYLFSLTSFPYFTLDNGSSLLIKYKLQAASTDELNNINHNGVEEYRLSEEDYMEIWGSESEYINAFAPSVPASLVNIRKILDKNIPSAKEGQYVVVNYNEASTNPIFGNISGGGDEPGDEFAPSSVLGNVEVGDVLDVYGYVTGICTQGFILSDNAGSIYFYGDKEFSPSDVAIGNQVHATGTISKYNNCIQIGTDRSFTVVGTGEYDYPTPTVYTSEMIDATCEENANTQAKYVEVTGKFTTSTNSDGSRTYYNIEFSDATHGGSLYNVPSFILDQLTSGETYTFRGYYVLVSGGYFNILVTEVIPATSKSSKISRAPIVEVTTTQRNSVYVYQDGSWIVPANTIVLQPGDYTDMNQSYGNLSGVLPDTMLPTYLNINYPYAAADDIMVVIFKFYNGKSTSYIGRQYIYSDTSAGWIDGNSVVDRFSKADNEWQFNPSVTITLPAGRNLAFSALYYQACTDWVYYNIDVPLGSTDIKSGKFYVTSYGNNEYYSGTSAYQNNVDLRASAARAQYPAAYEDMDDDEVVETMKWRFVNEVFPGALAMIYPDAKNIEGLKVLYTVTFYAYYSTEDSQHLATQPYIGVWEVVGPAQFKFVSCVSTGEDTPKVHNFLSQDHE